MFVYFRASTFLARAIVESAEVFLVQKREKRLNNRWALDCMFAMSEIGCGVWAEGEGEVVEVVRVIRWNHFQCCDG